MRYLAAAILAMAGCDGRALDMPDAPIIVTATDAAGSVHSVSCADVDAELAPSMQNQLRAVEIVWEQGLGMEYAALPALSWLPPCEPLDGKCTDTINGDGSVVAHWNGSFSCSPLWVDDLMTYRHYLQTSSWEYGYGDNPTDSAEHSKVIANLIESHL